MTTKPQRESIFNSDSWSECDHCHGCPCRRRGRERSLPAFKELLFASSVKDPRLLNQNSREKRMVEAPGWFLTGCLSPRGWGTCPPCGWLCCRAAWLVDLQVAIWGLLLKVIIFLPGTAPCWQLCDPKRALEVTNKAVKDTHPDPRKSIPCRNMISMTSQLVLLCLLSHKH